MGNLTGPTQISYDWFNQFVLSLGYNDTSDPSINQVRLSYEGGRYKLKAWDGSQFKTINEYTASDILSLLLTVDGTGSGLDSDKLDGEHGADFHDAAKLTGTVLRALLGDLWRDSDTNQTNSPYFQTGTAIVTEGTGTRFIPFDYAYTETPRVATGSNWPHIMKISSISTSGITMIPHSTTPYIVYIIALGRRQ